MGKFHESLCEQLDLHVRQLAWLHAVPEKAEGDRSRGQRKTRIELIEDLDGFIEVPPCDLPFMIDYLFEVGPMSNDGSISHGDIESWKYNTGVMIDAWQANTLRRLSVSYCNERALATDRNRPAPYDPEGSEKIVAETASRNFSASMASKFGS